MSDPQIVASEVQKDPLTCFASSIFELFHVSLSPSRVTQLLCHFPFASSIELLVQGILPNESPRFSPAINTQNATSFAGKLRSDVSFAAKTYERYSARTNCQNVLLGGDRRYACQNVSIVFNIPPHTIERSNAYFVDANMGVEVLFGRSFYCWDVAFALNIHMVGESGDFLTFEVASYKGEWFCFHQRLNALKDASGRTGQS
ncbi:hypothetical protein RHGRI_035956 [Rhododendron griersonianum]|uniref:Uncharacterized protein n=1 Tax=Rhododendron griersonianum TaxID=479676 RepID=A0AAV6HLL5_9ERIC|nr:hypothetical protein RHGRI_035956 [Rhododendron griersonianum]